MLQPTDYPEPVRNHMRRRLDGAEQLPKDADWSQLDRAERKLASALWITEGSGPYTAVDVFARAYPDLVEAIEDAFRS